MRTELNKILADKIENPSLDVSEEEVIKNNYNTVYRKMKI